MSQRHSGYEKRTLCLYETPAWVTAVLVDWLLPRGILREGQSRVWEPAAGTGKMVAALRAAGLEVMASDIHPHDGLDSLHDFRSDHLPLLVPVDAVITNPPYADAEAFVVRALKIAPVVAMLLPLAWDAAKTRRRLFADNPAFRAKLTLTSRVTWFEHVPGPGQKEHGPSEQHAWFVWDRASPPWPEIGWLHMPDDAAAALAARKRARRLGASLPREVAA